MVLCISMILTPTSIGNLPIFSNIAQFLELGIFTHYCKAIRLLTHVGGLGRAEVALQDLHNLNDPIIWLAKNIKVER
jgi:hypothetical protein